MTFKVKYEHKQRPTVPVVEGTRCTRLIDLNCKQNTKRIKPKDKLGIEHGGLCYKRTVQMLTAEKIPS